jgi:hypothetical protein
MTENIVSVVTRLGAEGFPDIYDLQYCLNGQNDSNFEWIVLVRPSAHEKIDEIRQEFQRTSDLYRRVRILKVDSDSRGGILNIALNDCEGSMIVVLDDDDIPLTNFIETINHFAKIYSCNSILRTLTFSQETHRLQGMAGNHQISYSKGIEAWPREFNLLSHIVQNQTPCMSLSFPVKKIKEYNVEWDSTLLAVEDWDFLMRAAENISVESISKVTSLYRRANGSYRSQKNTARNDWKESEQIVREKISNLTLKLKVGDLIENQYLGPNSLKTNENNLPQYYRSLIRVILPIANKFPRLYVILRKCHNKIVSRMKWIVS